MQITPNQGAGAGVDNDGPITCIQEIKDMLAEDRNEKVVMKKAVEEYLLKELRFRKDEIAEIGISELNRPKKIYSRTVHVTFKDIESATQIFRRSALVRNDELRVTNFIAPKYFAQYSALQLLSKHAREADL